MQELPTSLTLPGVNCETVNPLKGPCRQTKSPLGRPNVGMTIHTTDAIASRFMSWKINQRKRMDVIGGKPIIFPIASMGAGVCTYMNGLFLWQM